MNENGFTLIEILIAITITGIILGAVFMFLNQGLNTWENTAERGDWEQNWRIFNKQIKNDLHNLFYSPLYKDNLFKGDYQGISWLIKKDGILKEVSYTVDYYSNRLLRKEAPYQSTSYPEIDLRNDTSLNYQEKALSFFKDFNIYRVDYQYFDPQNNYWVNNWSLEERSYLPAVIKVVISNESFELPAILAETYLSREYERGVAIYE